MDFTSQFSFTTKYVAAKHTAYRLPPTTYPPLHNTIMSEEGTSDPEPKETLAEEAREDWEVQRDHHKGLADAAFRTSDYKLAIQEYSNAITFDPEYHILYSNRSAAYLANGEKSKSLADAKKCVSLKPEFVKGHSRLASSMISLGRWNEARNVYKHILSSLDTDNDVAKKGLQDCREKELKANEAEFEMIRLAQQEQEKESDGQSKKETDTPSEQSAGGDKEEDGEDEDDLLNDFFDEVEEVEPVKKPSAEEKVDETPAENKIQIQLSDLGDTSTQIQRLLRPNHEWYNLNPFVVLDISHQAPLDLLSRRYKALSLLLHPDKVRNSSNNDATMIEKAEEAFEFMRKAMNSLKDEDKAKHYRDLVEEGMKQGKRDYDANPSNTTLTSCQEKATMKIFAEIERKRRDVDRRKRNQDKREREQEDAEVDKMKKERNFDKNWKDGNRVEKRIGNWRDFSKDKRRKP